MIIVSDTGPLRYLVMLGVVDILPGLFGEVICPAAVLDECMTAAAPEALRSFASQPPEWLVVMQVDEIDERTLLLDRGESEAITLALRIRSDLLLIDERKGRQKATDLGLEITGTLAVLAAAGRRSWLDYQEITARLTTITSFRATSELIQEAWENASHGGSDQ